MFIVHDHRITTLKRLLVRPFSKIVHSYIVIPKTPDIFIYYDFGNNGLESTLRSGLPNNLVIQQIDCNNADAEKWLDAKIGCQYDNVSIFFNHLIDIDKQNPDKYTCSELIMELLKHLGFYKGDTGLTPIEVYNTVKGF